MAACACIATWHSRVARDGPPSVVHHTVMLSQCSGWRLTGRFTRITELSLLCERLLRNLVSVLQLHSFFLTSQSGVKRSSPHRERCQTAARRHDCNLHHCSLSCFCTYMHCCVQHEAAFHRGHLETAADAMSIAQAAKIVAPLFRVRWYRCPRPSANLIKYPC